MQAHSACIDRASFLSKIPPIRERAACARRCHPKRPLFEPRPCILQITNPVDGIELHSVVFGIGSTANANITSLTEMATARVLGNGPNVFFAAFDAAVVAQKITSVIVQAARTDIGLMAFSLRVVRA